MTNRRARHARVLWTMRHAVQRLLETDRGTEYLTPETTMAIALIEQHYDILLDAYETRYNKSKR